MKDRILIIVFVILSAGAGWYVWLSRPAVVTNGTYVVFAKDSMLSMGSDFFPFWTSDLFRWKLGSTEAPVLIAERRQEQGNNGCADYVIPTFTGWVNQHDQIISTDYTSSQVDCLNGLEDFRLDGASTVRSMDKYQVTYYSGSGSVSLSEGVLNDQDDFAFTLKDSQGIILATKSLRVRSADYDEREDPCNLPMLSHDGDRIYLRCGATFARYDWKIDTLTRFDQIQPYHLSFSSFNMEKELALGYVRLADVGDYASPGTREGDIYLLDLRSEQMTRVGGWAGQWINDLRAQEPQLAPDGQRYFQWNRIIAFNQNPDEASHTISGRLEDWVGYWMIFDRGNVLSAYNETDGQIVNLAQAVGNDRDPDIVDYRYIGTLTTN